MKLTEEQWTALQFSASDDGGWPRAKANERSWVVRSYRALERRGLVVEKAVPAGMKKAQGRLNFIATDAGRSALAKGEREE